MLCQKWVEDIVKCNVNIGTIEGSQRAIINLR